MKQTSIRIPASTGAWCTVLSSIGAIALTRLVSADNLKLNSEFNLSGNLLIADQFNNRVIETDPYGAIVWSFGLGPNDFSARSPIGVNDAQRVGSLTLMAGTGTPAGVIPQAPDGAVDNRVMLWTRLARSSGNTASSGRWVQDRTC